jgi:hypothetical protein
VPLWTPAEITTALWLDASDSGTLTLSGSDVTQWADKSGNGRHATPPISAKPTWTASGINSIGSVVFPASAAPLVTPSFSNPAGADGITIAMVLEKTGEPVNFSNPLTKGATNTEWSIVLENAANGAKSNLRNNLTTGNTAKSSTNFGTSTPRVVSGYIANSGIAQFFTGNPEGTQGSATRSFGSSSVLTIGSSPDSTYTANRFQGRIGEIILIHGDITTATRQKLEGYLAHKWGLASSLPIGHPYKSAAPYLYAPGSVDKGATFGKFTIANVSDLQVTFPGSTKARTRFGAFQTKRLLEILQPGAIKQPILVGKASVFEPSFIGECELETVIEPNAYTGECVLETIIQSDVYMGECVLETVIEPNVYTGECILETVIESAPYTGECELETIILDRGVLDADWKPRIKINGSTISNDKLVGQGTIRAGRSVSRTAQFSYVLDAAEAESFNVLHFHRKLVEIDYIAGTQAIRRFTGQVQAADWDAKQRIVTLHCADFLEESLIRLDFSNAAALAQTSSWSDVVFGDAPATAREYLDQLLEISPVSVQCDAYGLLRAAPLLPAGSIATLTADDIEDGTQSVTLADTKQIVNKFEVELTTRAACCYGAIKLIHYKMGQSLTPPIGFSGPAWAWPVRIGGTIMQRSMIEEALNSTGWRLMGDVNYVAPPLDLVYKAPVQQTGINGSTSTSITDVVFYLKPPEIQNQLAVEFTANMALEWGQVVEVKDKIVVAWNASIATYGELAEQERYLADTDFDVRAWEASKRDTVQKVEDVVSVGWGGKYTDADGSSSGGSSVFGKAYGDAPHVGQGVVVKAGKNGLGWGYGTQAIACIVKRCQTEILKSHLANTYSCSLMYLAPGIEIGDGLTPGAGTIVESEGPLSVAGYTDVWDFERMDFHTELEMQFIPVLGTATEYSSTPQTFQKPTFAEGYTSPESGSPFSTTTPVTYYGEQEGGEARMEITMPAIPDQYRETESQDRTGTPLNHGVWWSANNVTIEAPERY